MANKHINDAIIKAAAESGVKIKINEETFNSTLKSLGIDSLGAMGIIINTEKALNVRLPDEELASLKTLDDVISAFEKQVK